MQVHPKRSFLCQIHRENYHAPRKNQLLAINLGPRVLVLTTVHLDIEAYVLQYHQLIGRIG